MDSVAHIQFELDSVYYNGKVYAHLGRPMHYVLTELHPSHPGCARDYFWDFAKTDLPGFNEACDYNISLEVAIAIRVAERARRFIPEL